MAMTLLNLRDAAAKARAEALAATAEEKRQAREALAPQLFNLGDPEDASFRRITSPANARDLNPLMQERMQQVCFFLAVTTPFGKRIVEIITSYVVGEGFQLVADEPAVQEVIDRFRNDPVNRFEENLRAWTRELAIFGELCLPVALNPVDGFVRLGYIDPQQIAAVEYGALLTGNGGQEISIPVAVRLKTRLGESQGRRLTIIRLDEDINSPTFGQLTGECFYVAINKAKSASRGLSELFSLADWIDVFDQMVFDFADKIRFLNAFVWHYILKGANEKVVEDFKKKVTQEPPKQGGVQVTNDQVEIEARTPDFKGADMHEAARMVKLYGLGGAGLPAWFFADPVDANRSTAQEMEGPTGKKLTDWQNLVKSFVRGLVDFTIDQARARGVLAQGVNAAYRIQVPDLSMRDLAKAAASLPLAANALALAEDRGWVRAETAAHGFHLMLSQLGLEIDSKQEFEKARQERALREGQAINQLNPQEKLADALRSLPRGQEKAN